jgi:iron complex outermembrane receptor protein
MRSILAGGAAMALAAACPAAAWAQTRTFDLRAQSAVTAIPEFARQAGVQIVAPADELRDVRTPRIVGPYEVRTALKRLIGGAGLEVAADDGQTITLRRRRTAAFSPAVTRPREQAPPLVSKAVDPLIVFGGGEVRQVQLVRARELDRAEPGSSPFRLIDKLPSVNFESADGFGMNEWSTRIEVRNFVQGRLGFTLDDVPLGDMTYGNHNGLHVTRAITTENLSSVELAQGAGSLEAASASNLGGTIKFVSQDPSYTRGASLAASAGSDNTRRAFLRLESGELSTGLRADASYLYATTDKWQGAGAQYVQQVNLKAIQSLGEASLTGFLNLSRRREHDPQDLSLDMIRRLGLGWDNVTGDWALAVRLAEIGGNRGDTGAPAVHPEVGTVFPAPIATVDDAYYDSTTARDDALAAVTLRTPVGDKLDVKTTVYGHWDKGQGLWWTPFVASPNYGVAGATHDNAPISIRSTDYDIRRGGVLAALTAHLGDHTVTGGLWIEDIGFTQARRFFAEDLAAPRRDYTAFQTNPFRTEWAYHFTTRTRQAYLQDTWTASEDLTVSVGFKSLSVTNRIDTLAGEDKSGSIRAVDHFLPQLGVRYRLGPASELFADYARGMRAFSASNTSGPFSTSKAAFDVIRARLKPEISDSFEFGWRRSSADVTLLAAIYAVRFHNRLFSTPVGSGILGDPDTVANVGSVSAHGLETAAAWKVADDWSVFASYAYNRAVYDDDVFDGDGVLLGHTKGKNAVDAPHHLVKARLDYDHDGLFARLGLSYLSERYITFENDLSVPGQVLADLTLGRRFAGPGWRNGLEVQLNVTNLFDLRYVATIGSNDFQIKGDSQTLLAGAPRQVFVALRKSF